VDFWGFTGSTSRCFFEFVDGDEHSSWRAVYGAMMKFFSIFKRNPASLKREIAMKKMLLLSLAVLLMLMPGTASAGGSFLTVTIAPDGLSFTITGAYSLWVYTVTFCDGTEDEFSFDHGQDIPTKIFHYKKPISHVEAQYGIPNGLVFTVEASRNCEFIGAEPLFMMWLMTRGDQGCILLSETHPSVERQKALCFPATDPDWVADSAPCADYVYSNDTWSCDAFGFSRLPLHDENGPDLMEVWQRHAARQEE
jgi:hypothetical protein